MRSRAFPVLSILVGLLSCSDNSDAFLPFADLCPVYAEQVCAARESCCELSETEVDCVLRVSMACDVERALLEAESALKYESEEAQRTRESHEVHLESCEPPYALSRFFSGGKADGDACERAAQCLSFSCVEAKCAAVEPVPLCEF